MRWENDERGVCLPPAKSERRDVSPPVGEPSPAAPSRTRVSSKLIDVCQTKAGSQDDSSRLGTTAGVDCRHEDAVFSNKNNVLSGGEAMTDLESRVTQIERSNRRLRVGLLALSSVLGVVLLSAAGSDESTFPSIATKRVVIGDASTAGNTVMLLDATDGKSASIKFQRITDGPPKTLASLSTEGGASVLALRDPNSVNLMKMAIDGRTASVEGISPNGQIWFLLSADDKGLRIPQ